MMNEVGDLAGQHELIAEDMTSTVLLELQLLTRNLKDDRKKVTGHPRLGLIWSSTLVKQHLALSASDKK
jgi:hypothetical protein